MFYQRGGTYFLADEYAGLKDKLNTIRRVALQLTEARSDPASFSLNGDGSTHEVNPLANIPSSARSFNQDIVFQDEPGIVNTPA